MAKKSKNYRALEAQNEELKRIIKEQKKELKRMREAESQNDDTALDFSSVEEVKKAFIASEILNRKY